MKLGVLGLVHHAHATAAKLFENAVVRNRLADHVRRHPRTGSERATRCASILGVAGTKINRARETRDLGDLGDYLAWPEPSHSAAVEPMGRGMAGLTIR